MTDVEGYEKLREVLELAYNQSAHGKGKERHANARPFDKQPIMEIGRMVGVGYQLGQVMKKAQEAGGMAKRSELEAAMAELLGVIVYAAAAFQTLAERTEKDNPYLPLGYTERLRVFGGDRNVSVAAVQQAARDVNAVPGNAFDDRSQTDRSGSLTPYGPTDVCGGPVKTP